MPLESQIQAEVDQLRDRFPATKDLYREVCVLLFFRYGVTPTANKLYGFVRKGSMSAPANALDAFWHDLREKSRVRIESPDIPAALLETVGETFSALWRQAQEYAECNFTQRMLEATEQVELLKSEAETTASRNLDMEAGIESLKLQLVEADQRAKDIERLRLTDCSTLAAQDKTITSLSAERDRLVKTLGVVSPNRRKFRQPNSSPATIASRSMTWPSP